MPRRLVMSLAMSLDGFIADEAGGYDWIKGDESHSLDTPNRWDYEAFLQGVDAVVMGRAWGGFRTGIWAGNARRRGRLQEKIVG